MATQPSPRPHASKRNSFQKMLELERHSKINRMQGGAPLTVQPRFVTPTSPPARHSTTQVPPLPSFPSMPLGTHGRSTSAPMLSLVIPPNPSQAPEPLNKAAHVSPAAQFEDEDDRSPVVSICQSPSWSDHGEKERREQRKAAKQHKKEIEKMEKQARAALKKTKRLSKAPPTSWRPGKIGGSRRSSSDSGFPTLPSPSAASRFSVETRRNEDSPQRYTGNISSADGFSGPQRPTLSSSVTTGFIGGLKLKNLNEPPRRQLSTGSNDDRGSGAVTSDYHMALANDKIFKSKTGGSKPPYHGREPTDTSFVKAALDLGQSIRLPENNKEEYTGLSPVKGVAQWDSASYASRIARGRDTVSSKVHDNASQHSEQGYQYHTLLQPRSGEPVSRKTMKAAFEEDLTRFGTGGSRSDLDSPTGVTQEAHLSMTAPSSNGSSYVKKSRRQSADLAVAGFEEEDMVSRAYIQHLERESHQSNVVALEDQVPDVSSPSAPHVIQSPVGNSTPDGFQERSECSRENITSENFKRGRRRRESKEVVPKSPVLSFSGFQAMKKAVFGRNSTSLGPMDRSGHPTPPASSSSDQESTLNAVSMTQISKAKSQNGSATEFRISQSSSLTTDQSDENIRTHDSSNVTTPTKSRPDSGSQQRNVQDMSKTHRKEKLSRDDKNASTEAGDKNTNKNVPHRKPSLLRSTSTPQLNDLSFLPPLKHQSLRKRDTSKPPVTRASKSYNYGEHSDKQYDSESSAAPKSSKHLANARAQVAKSSRLSQSTDRRLSLHEIKKGPVTQPTEPTGKMFVVCCKCNHWHDMPSKLYQAMCMPANSVVEDKDLGVQGRLTTAVVCPWCSHGMSTQCCPGYATVVYIQDRLH